MKQKYLLVITIVTSFFGLLAYVPTASAADIVTFKFDCNKPEAVNMTSGAGLGERCGVKDRNGVVIFCGAQANKTVDMLCTTNEFNYCPTNVCLVRIDDECTSDAQCEGGAYCKKEGAASGKGICDVDTGDVSLGGTLGTGSDIRDTARRVINIALGFLGVLVVIMVIYGGALWLTSAGAEEKVTKGKNILVWAALGAILISIAWTITSYILKVGKSMG